MEMNASMLSSIFCNLFKVETERTFRHPSLKKSNIFELLGNREVFPKTVRYKIINPACTEFNLGTPISLLWPEKAPVGKYPGGILFRCPEIITSANFPTG